MSLNLNPSISENETGVDRFAENIIKTGGGCAPKLV